MSQNIIKEQEYIRVDEEPKAPKTITHNSQKYVRCDTIEQDLKRCKEATTHLLRAYPEVERFSPVLTRKIINTNGNKFAFIIQNIEFNPSKSKSGLFDLFMKLQFKSKFAQILNFGGAKYLKGKILPKGKTSSGNEIYEVAFAVEFKNKPKR